MTYNPEAMEAVNAMLQSYQSKIDHEQRSKSVDIDVNDQKKPKQKQLCLQFQ